MLLIYLANTEQIRVLPLKDKKGITISNASQKLLNKLGRNSKKTYVDKGGECYNRLMKLSKSKAV